MENRFTKFNISITTDNGYIVIKGINDYELDKNKIEEEKSNRYIINQLYYVNKLKKLNLEDYRTELEMFIDKVVYLVHEVIK